MASDTNLRGLSRRAFLKGAAALAALWPLLPPPVASEAAATPEAAIDPSLPRGAMPLERMAGEQLDFLISFWIFSRAGSARLGLAPLAGRPGLYQASMSGHTSGIVGFLTRHREDTYLSTMELAGGRLRPLKFQEEVIIGHRLRRRRTSVFDYEAGRILRRKMDRAGKVVEAYELPMEPGVVYDDYLSGIYNLRLGAYGPLREGRAYTLHVPRRKGGVIRVELAGGKELHRRLEREGRQDGKAFFSRVLLDKDGLGSGTGKLQGWFSAHAVPLSGLIEDVILFGDVEGRLLRRVAPS